MAILWVLLISSLAASSTAKVLPNFAAVKTGNCPTPAASLLPQKLTSKLQCAAFCSRLPTCNAFHFNKNTGQCFHGDACSQLDQWTADGDCDSYKYTDVLCGDCDVAEPVLTELKLKLFYKFSRSGLKNEVNPRQFCLTAHDVTVNAGGAHFEGNSGSYLSTKTPGFGKFFSMDPEFSAFARVRHSFGTGYQFYHRFLQCNGNSGNTFAKHSDYIYNGAVLSNDAALFTLSPSVLPPIGPQKEISVGFAFNRTAHQHFYFNGSIAPVFFAYTEAAEFSPSLFECLRLGQSSTDSNCLSGSMLCYGFSNKVLSLQDFHQVQQLCDQE